MRRADKCQFQTQELMRVIKLLRLADERKEVSYFPAAFDVWRYIADKSLGKYKTRQGRVTKDGNDEERISGGEGSIDGLSSQE